MTFATLLLFAGLLLLTVGADVLVRGAAALALRLGLTPLVIGLTVVAFGTSAPELVVSAAAAQRGSAAIAVGNVVGSNLCNLALILGLCALIRPLTASHTVIRREVPLLIAATLVTTVLLLDRAIGGWEGAGLLGGLALLTWRTVTRARTDPDQTYDHRPQRAPALPLAGALTGGGLLLLLVGSDWFVDGAVELARSFGWSETLIGLTVVAIGTSLPELATSATAVLKGENDVAIGNVVGSSVFNVLGILGLVGVAGGAVAPELSLIDLGLLLVVTLALWPLVKTGGRISRTEGGFLLVIYLAYLGWSILTA